MAPTEIDSYIEYLVENHGWVKEEVQLVCKDLLEVPSEPSYQDFLFRVLKAFIIEYYADIAYEIIENKPVVSDPNYAVFKWKYKEATHALLLSSEQIEELRVMFLLLDSDNSLFDNSESLRGLSSETRWLHIRSSIIYFGLTGEVIPLMSDTVNIDEGTARFSSAVWYEEIQKKTVLLAGVGGIGSYVGFLLSRIKPKELFVYDDDKVEPVNMAGQLFSYNDVHQFKVDALAGTVLRYSAYNTIFAIRERFTKETDPSDIMICGFDNMAARKLFFNKWLQHVNSKSDEEKKHCLFIDGRLAAEEFQVLCIRGDDTYNCTRYAENFLFSDEEADETPCSYKQTSYMANLIGSIIVNLFVNFVANELVEGLRDLPFLTSYVGDSMTFKTEN